MRKRKPELALERSRHPGKPSNALSGQKVRRQRRTANQNQKRVRIRKTIRTQTRQPGNKVRLTVCLPPKRAGRQKAIHRRPNRQIRSKPGSRAQPHPTRHRKEQKQPKRTQEVPRKLPDLRRHRRRDRKQVTPNPNADSQLSSLQLNLYKS